MGSKNLKINSDEIMKIAEKLYNEGIISYPRTETDVFAPTFDVMSLIEKQTSDPNWGTYATGLLNGKFKQPRKGSHNDEAHPPIHPVRSATNLVGNEKKLYDFITRRFLACCSMEARGQGTQISLTLGGEGFSASGLVVLERNYLDVYPFDQWNGNKVGAFVQGETVDPSALELKQGSTTKPNYLTEAELIGLMDKSGIGTDATIHEHIKTIQTREYVNKEGEYFVPTVLGMSLVMGYDQMSIDISLSRPELRALMELNMKNICNGTMSKEQVIREVSEMYKETFRIAQQQAETLVGSCSKYFTSIQPQAQSRPVRDPGVFIRHCWSCRSAMHLRNIKPEDTRKVIGCSKWPGCKATKWIPDCVVSIQVLDQNCPHCTQGDDMVVKKVKIDFKRNSIPPHLDNPNTCCLWCDTEVAEILFPNQKNPEPLQPAQALPLGPSQYHISTSIPALALPQSLTVPPNQSRQNLAALETAGSTHHPTCRCNLPAATRTSKTEQTMGREFYCCPNPKDASCGFFQWTDEPEQKPARPSSGHRVSGTLCTCGIAAVVRTSRKESSLNREFFVCSKMQQDATRCDYFAWADEPLAPSRSFTAPDPPSNRPTCQCGLVATVGTVYKEGPNKGRKFLGCPKAGHRCKFFAFLDHDGNIMDDDARGNGSASAACFKCGSKGHFASRCPQTDGGSYPSEEPARKKRSGSKVTKKTRGKGGSRSHKFKSAE
ncbi:hypothetical protein HDU91_006698 [Kappamyces sp. JEL0680]|nr:hypothetical protein HDU91_006698 [Kappamyces sp. JEL0680]